MRNLLYVSVVGALAAPVLLFATWPQAAGLHRSHLFAQLTALRGLIITAAAVGALLFFVLAWRNLRWRRRLVALASVLVAVAVINVAIMADRGFGGGRAHDDGEGDLTVFTWNTLEDAPPPELIARFALEHGANVLALVETSAAAATEVADLLEAAGRRMQVFALESPDGVTARSTALLVAWSLGEYEIDLSVGSTPRVMSVVARPTHGEGPTLISTHTMPPLLTTLRTWEQGLRWLAERCAEGNVIVAGDLNATVDHLVGLREPGAALGACRDGATVMGSAALGTWPSRVPMFFGSPIDHVMATSEWEFVSFRVAHELDGAGSDHRALLATLKRSASAQE